MVSFLLALTIIAASAGHIVSNCIDCFNKGPRKGLLTMSIFWLFRVRISREFSDKLNNDSSLGLELSGRIQSPSPPVTVSLLVFSATFEPEATIFQGYCGAGDGGGWRMGLEQVVTPQISCSYWDSTIYLSCLLDYCNSLAYFQNSEETDFDHFFQCSHCFDGGVAFLLAIPVVLLPSHKKQYLIFLLFFILGIFYFHCDFFFDPHAICSCF